MTAPLPPPKGGAPVAALDDVEPLARLAVLSFRRWCDGAPDAPGDAAQPFDALCRLCLGAARRPLARHGMACPCVGADEACFAALVREAAEGEREDALMLACLLVRPDFAPALVHLAQGAGLALRRALLRPSTAAVH